MLPKLEHPNVLFSLTATGKFLGTYSNVLGIEIVFENNYRYVAKNQCPGIFIYFSKSIKSMKMPVFARKKEHLL